MDRRWLTTEPKQTRWRPPKWHAPGVVLVRPDDIVGKGQGEDSPYPTGYDPTDYFPPQGDIPAPVADPADNQAIRDQEAQQKLRAQTLSGLTDQPQPPTQPPETPSSDRGWPGAVSDGASGLSQGLGNEVQRRLQNPQVAGEEYIQSTPGGKMLMLDQQAREAEAAGDTARAEELRSHSWDELQNVAVMGTMGGAEEVGGLGAVPRPEGAAPPSGPPRPPAPPEGVTPPTWVVENSVQIRNVMEQIPALSTVRDEILDQAMQGRTAQEITRGISPVNHTTLLQVTGADSLGNAVRQIRAAYGVPSAGVGEEAANLQAMQAAYQEARRRGLSPVAALVDTTHSNTLSTSMSPVPPTEPPHPPTSPPTSPPPEPPEDGGGIAGQIRQGMEQGPTPEYDPTKLPPGVPRPKVEEMPPVEANVAREVLPEMAGTPAQAAQLRPEEEGHIGNISAEPFPDPVQQTLHEMQEVDELNNFAGARQGVRADPQVMAEAEQIANTHTLDYWLNRDPHAPMTDSENIALGQTIVQQEGELRRLTRQSADTMARSVTSEDLAVARQHQAAAADQALTLATLVGMRQGTAAAAGRALRSFRQALGGEFGSQSSAQFLDRAFKAAGLDRAEFTRFLQTYAAIPADDYVSRYRALAGLSKPSLWDRINAYAVSNILSAPATTTVVAAHGTMMAYARPMLTAVRDGNLREAVTDLGAMNRAWGSALPGMWQAFREGVGPTTAEMHLTGNVQDVNPLVFAGKKGMVITPALRTISALHEFFNTISLAGATEVQAQRIFNEVRSGAVPAGRSAAREFYSGRGMTPRGFQAHVGGLSDEQLVAAIRQNMPARALRAAQESVRQTVTGGNMSPFGKSIAYMRRFANSDNVGERWFGRAAQFVEPFVRYPDFYYRNGAKILFGPAAYPVLAAKHAMSAETRGLVGGDLRVAALTSAVMAPIVYNAIAGNITGPGPKNADQRAALMASREPDGSPTWRPMSARLGGRWVPFTTLGGVLSIPMAVVAGAVDAAHEDADFTEPIPGVTAKVFGAVLQTLADTNTFSQFTDLMQQVGSGPDLKKLGEGFVASGLGRFVPVAGLARQAAIAMDPNVKAPENILQRIEQNIPGLRQRVPNRLSPFGEQLRTPQDVGAFILRAEGPAADLYNPALRGLVKLGITPGAPDNHLSLFTGTETALTKEQQDQWRQQFGHVFASLWAKLTPEQQQDKEAMSEALSNARTMTTENFKASLTPEQILKQTTLKSKGDPRSQQSALEMASELRDVKRFPEFANPQTGAVLGSPADWARWNQVLKDKATPAGKTVPKETLQSIQAAKTAGMMKRDQSLFDLKRDSTGKITDVAIKDPRYADYNRWFGVYRGLEDETYLGYLRGDTPRYRNPTTGAVATPEQSDAADRWLQLYRDTPTTSPLHIALRPGALARMKLLTPNWENRLRQIDRADLMEEAGVIAEREAQFAGTAP